MREYRSVYTVPTVYNGNEEDVVIPREYIWDSLIHFGKFTGQVHYVDSKGRSTGNYDITLKLNKNSDNYIVSENLKRETIGTLTSDSFLKGNDTRLIFGKNYCKSVEQMIQKRIQSRGVKQKKNSRQGNTKQEHNRLKDIFAKYLNSRGL